MTDYVELTLKRNRGWPWPEDSYGLTPMFGEDGWCHDCGVPNRPQIGPIFLQRSRLSDPQGAWVPNWQFDVICVDTDLASAIRKEFDVVLWEVGWPRTPPGDAWQLVIPTVGEAWFDPDELKWATVAKHGKDGSLCAECGVWRWYPLDFGNLPPLRIQPPLPAVDIAASPEWFGDGRNAFRQLLARRELAELVAAASPRDFKITEVEWAD